MGRTIKQLYKSKDRTLYFLFIGSPDKPYNYDEDKMEDPKMFDQM